jgi:hypothetical protein
MTLLHPNRIPKQLNIDVFNSCAQRFTLVRILLSRSETPGGTALRRVFLPNARLYNLVVAGTCSSCGSCNIHSLLVVLLCTSGMRRSTSNPKLLLYLLTLSEHFAAVAAMLVKSLSHRRVQYGLDMSSVSEA